MDFLQQYEKWLGFDGLEKELRDELLAIKNDEKEIKERFYAPLSFGTAGLRGIIRAGLNGMNIYTVAQATQGLAVLVNKENRANDGVIIASDTRIKSDEFVRVCAEVLAANGIKTFVFDAPRPTPELSYALREMKAAAGINITASHNPKQYNGYKAYWSDGAQISPEQAVIVSDAINSVDIFTGVKRMDFDEGVKAGLITIIGKEIDEKYMKVVLEHRINPDAIPAVADDFKVVYTPFHGTGAVLVPEVLKRAGLKHLFTVAEQMIPDGNFPTVKSPNPEDKEGFAIGIEIAKKEGCDLIVGTDPDADRTGVILRTSDGEFIPLTGNQIGVMLISYIIEARKLTGNLPENACIIKSIVSTPLADAVCKANGVTLMEVLTGFKFIGEKMTEFEETKEYTYIFGFEESYGYLCGGYARDKDAVSASMLIVEMAAFYAKQGKTLYDVLCGIFEKYGYYVEGVQNLAFPGVDGADKMKSLMQGLRDNAPTVVGGKKVVSFSDYKTSVKKNADGTQEEIKLPKSDVLLFVTECGDKIFVRPSGTEPKVKLYYLANDKTKEAVDAKIAAYTKDMTALMN
ncbi:MAG: phospho-sugar mutase [Ruminococcaceae bacterium]|nr:phospho-sugar mutase [Oscillospiraceae bacterium]